MSSTHRYAFYPRGRGGAHRQKGGVEAWKQSKAIQLTPSPPLGEVLATIYPSDLQGSKADSNSGARITNSQYLTSYNWLAGKHPHIIIPGEPPSWTPLPNGIRLQEDSGQYFRDRNASRYPSYPLEPMVQAILTDKPDFPLRSIDIVACGSTLGNLLRFVRGQVKPFRMLVEVLDETVFFIRRENSPTEVIPDVHGYGHAFPEANTAWSADVKGSESHQRVINYEFAGIKCLVRFESDGYLPHVLPKDRKLQEKQLSGKKAAEPEYDFLSALEKTTVSSVAREVTEKTSRSLEITKGGEHIPQSAIFDLKTRSIKKKHLGIDTLGEELPRLWIAQIPNFILAYHRYGVFRDVEVRDVRENVKQWEESQQSVLAKFATLLRMIVSFARSSEHRRLEITREEDSAVLALRSQCEDVGRALPSHIANRWDDEFTEKSEDLSEKVVCL